MDIGGRCWERGRSDEDSGRGSIDDERSPAGEAGSSAKGQNVIPLKFNLPILYLIYDYDMDSIKGKTRIPDYSTFSPFDKQRMIRFVLAMNMSETW